MKTEHKSFGYGEGALAVLVISIGVAAIIYSLNLLAFDLYNMPAWIFGPLGVYTVIYSAAAGKEATYYMVWGAVMAAVAVVSAFYNKVSAVLVFGILIIVLAIIGIIAYWRSKR